MTKKLAAAGLLCTVLAACGGGGDDDPSPPPTPANASAEGFWTGKASTGTDVALVVLENGETWGFYASGGYIVGALAGNTSVSGSQVSGTGKDFDLTRRTVTPGSFSGTVTTKGSISIKTSYGATLTASYSSFYEQPASLATLAGSYTGQGVTGSAAVASTAVTITAAGQVTMPAVNGCGASGTAKPRSSGKNIFDLTVTFSGSTCALGNGATTRGVAYYESGKLLAMALNSAKTDGFIYVGSK